MDALLLPGINLLTFCLHTACDLHAVCLSAYSIHLQSLLQATAHCIHQTTLEYRLHPTSFSLLVLPLLPAAKK